ncbi:hypothetical protein NLX83_08750 [Allokutzneria sp. A3M-2-11 16]|uniref:hypothetical protein n=1 Tax=Allokutzneria sp. A3M-2-11 16 TaxID=2962043 RepID=UPI0020B8A97C|nr:hypothetical protein [Allokutzneria sp. A3M-2-11 16]MCP3799341.1 hypothetical protein [Allokutzneria sp. A3M-2-11 16]
MGQADDPERLLAEALRAQAASTPASGSSGSGGWGDNTEAALRAITGTGPTERVDNDMPTVRTDGERAPLRPRTVLLLAVLLGLAVGTVAGLVSVL